ncbi:MAG TPA: hypothetical protein VEI83_13420 [Acidimicrobiales bacterium]|nr:hypothetical protein [Acidimicrobiales bacterium]
MNDEDRAAAPHSEPERLRRELEQWRRRAETAEARFDGVVERLRYGVLVFGEDGALVFANGAARAALQRTSEGPLAGRPALTIPATGDERRIELSAVPTVWDGRPGSLVILSDLSPRPGSRAGSGDTATTPVGEPVAEAGSPLPDVPAIRCVVEELPALRSAFGSEVSESVATEILDRLRAFLGGSGTVRREGNEFLVARPGIAGAEAAQLAEMIRAVAEDPVTIGGIRVTMSARVDLRSAGGEPAGGRGHLEATAGPTDKRNRVRGVLFSGTARDG